MHLLLTFLHIDKQREIFFEGVCNANPGAETKSAC